MKRSDEILRLKELHKQRISYYLQKETETIDEISKLNSELQAIIHGSKPDEDITL